MSHRFLRPAGALLYLSAAWMTGVATAAALGSISWPAALAVALLGLAVAAFERRPHAAAIGVLAVICFVGGSWRYLDQQLPEARAGLALHNDGSSVRIRALVSDEPDIRGRSQRVRLDVRALATSGRWEPAAGGVLLSTGAFPRYRYGDVLEVEGELMTPPKFPDFDYREYLAQLGIGSVVSYPESVRLIDRGEGNPFYEVAHDIRRALSSSLAKALPEPQAALAQGILIGQRASIPADLTADMNATGTTHLIAISGQNISLVAGLVITSFAWIIGRRNAAVVALLTIAAYTLLTGMSPTVTRAAIMGGLFVGATLFGRPASAATAIAFAAAAMTALDPQLVRNVSFQLSFAAIAGLVYLAPPFQRLGAGFARSAGVDASEGGPASFFIEAVAVTAAAVLATLPLIAMNFERVSVAGLVANLLLVPAFPFILVSAALTAAAGMVWAPAAEAFGWFAWVMLSYMIAIAETFASLPLASIKITGFGSWHAAASYAALGCLALWLGRRPLRQPDEELPVGFRPFRVSPVWYVAAVLAIAAGAFWAVTLDSARAAPGRLTVSILDVGQGDAILIETPRGDRILVDGGANGPLLAERLGDELPFWERAIDLVALTHPDADHINGVIDALDRYDVREVITAPTTSASAPYREFRERIERGAIPSHEAHTGDWIDLGDGASLRVLGPSPDALASNDENDASLVLKLVWRDASFLLTGDIEASGELALLRSAGRDALKSTVLKVPHHGSKTSSTGVFLRAVRPAVSVVSAGQANPYGHPAPEVIDRLDDSALVLRTDERGTIRLTTDGERLWIDTDR